jgi:hypothetical protein
MAAMEEARTSSSSSRGPLLQPGKEYTIHILVSMVVDEDGWWWWRWWLAADDSVNGSGRQVGGLLPFVVGGGKAIVGRQWTIAG